MSRKKPHIPFPNEKVMEREIEAIISRGLDPTPSFGRYLLTMYRQIGFRYIFRDATEIAFTLFLSIIILTFLSISVGNYAAFEQGNLYTWIFGWSPALYMIMAYFFFMNKKQSPIYEVEMTCKYNMYQLAAFRMLFFGLVAMLMNGFMIFLIASEYQLNFYFAFILSTTSLFLFATLFLYAQLKMKSLISKLAVIAGWGLINMFLSYFSSEVYQTILQQIPFYVYGVISICGFILYYKHLKKLTVYARAKGVV
ncbi:hypothetical protein [Bacillus piscicola]|uniref:hypothetical protein n=1 Tax=Bacillus piscicola TaxID=1632684 RepID=UPI001F095DFE|nr:hypothetical protein [Bacillus piscicola]